MQGVTWRSGLTLIILISLAFLGPQIWSGEGDRPPDVAARDSAAGASALGAGPNDQDGGPGIAGRHTGYRAVTSWQPVPGPVPGRPANRRVPDEATTAPVPRVYQEPGRSPALTWR